MSLGTCSIAPRFHTLPRICPIVEGSITAAVAPWCSRLQAGDGFDFFEDSTILDEV